MPSLHSTLRHLMDEFVDAVVGALRASSVQDLLGAVSNEDAAPYGARPRARTPTSRVSAPKRLRVVRSTAELAADTQRIVARVAKSPRGLQAGELRAAVGLEGRAFERALHHALAAGGIARQGTRGKTRYLPANGRALRPSSRPARGPRVHRAPSASVEHDAREAYDTHEAAQIHDPEALLRQRQDAPTLPIPPPRREDPALVVDAPVTLARLSTPTLRAGEEILRTPTGSAVLRRRSSSAV
jgi:hypothetical protein